MFLKFRTFVGIVSGRGLCSCCLKSTNHTSILSNYDNNKLSPLLDGEVPRKGICGRDNCIRVKTQRGIVSCKL